jgi:hypothetical protein
MWTKGLREFYRATNICEHGCDIQPFYGEKTDLSSLIDFDSPSICEASREGESEVLSTNRN